MTRSTASRWGLPVLLLAAIMLAACDGTAEPTGTATSPSSPGDTASIAPTGPESSGPTDSASPTEATTPATLPGRKVDAGVARGEQLTVIGVSYDDQLSLLTAPGGDEAVTALAPRSDVVATGRSRTLGRGPDGGVWHEVEGGGATGWVPARSLAWVGQTTDETQAMLRAMGKRPVADTMLGLGRIVTRASAYNDPSSGSRVVVSVAPTEGDVAEVTYDVTGIADDSVAGVRIHLFAVPTEAGRYSLTSVELTYLCGRGLDQRDRCV